MPEIQEYSPQVAVPEGIGSVSQNIEMAGAVGKSLEKFGSDVAEGSMQIQRRNAQEETSQVYSHITDLSANLNQEVQQGIQDGTLNQEDVLQKFDDQNEKLQGNLSTPQAQNYLNRLQSRFRGHLMRTMAVGQAQIAKNAAIGGLIDARNKSGNAIFQDPSSFQDYYEAGVEDLDQRIQNGGLPESMRTKAQQEMGQDFATQAVRGWANLDTDKARELLNGDPTKDQKPAFDDFISPDKKFQLNKEIDARDRANEVEGNRATRLVEKEQKAKQEAWYANNFKAFSTGALSTHKIQDAVRNKDISPELGAHLINAQREANERGDQFKSDVHVYKDLVRRISDINAPDAITSKEELLPYVAKGKIAPMGSMGLGSLDALIDKTPDGQAMRQGQKALFDGARKAIMYDNGMGGTGTVGWNKFVSDFSEAKSHLPQGAKPSDLVDPKSPLYFGNKINQYATPLSERYKIHAEERTDKALGLKPTGSNPEPTPAPNARKPGESIPEWKTRTKYKGGP